MEELCKKLDYIKSVVTNLISSNCVDIETMYTKCLTKFPSEKQQLLKIREVKLEIETQLRQLIRKAEEVCATKQMCEELKLKLDEKELAILNERAQRFDAEGRQMAIVLDEVVRGFEGEIEGLKTLLPVLCNKCDDQVEINAKGFKELRDIDDDLLGMLEDENVKIKNELKREKGRFKQLEEAYGNVQDDSV
ncbi:hypothetical protein GIB67_034690 [Kingdonia uniflora]|uniref:Uncharacterized protein n=1 Tax=Kingdonia uniflora TaxID=39325 RepID=A0A7J7P0Y1_9MAGN|nr:hypothetical protein GIB67_034690 [Kingdonia uniflora]